MRVSAEKTSGSRTTLRDVAREVGVSASAVAVVLNGVRSGTKVSAERRRAILEAADRLGYRANVVAQSLRRQRTGLVGLYTDYECLSSLNPFLSELVGGLQEACAEAGLDLVLQRFDPSWSEADLVRSLTDRRVDALAFYSPPENRLSRALAEVDIPAVALVEWTPDIASVIVDDREGGRLVARRLHSRGCRHVIYRSWIRPPISGRRRYEGLAEECERLGVRVSLGRPIDETRDCRLTEHEWELLREGPNEASAFFCFSDSEGHGTVHALQAAGFRVPYDVAVIAFNGLPSPFEFPYTLTSVVAPWRRVGRTALDLLRARLEGKPTPLETVLPVHLREGTTA